MSKGHLDFVIKPKEFFREKITSALDSQKMQVTEDIEYYLVNLLCNYITTPQLTLGEKDFNSLDTPLAILLKKALEAAPSEKIKIYKFMGDTSLYVSGYFQDYFNRKTFDIDYYMNLGSIAYRNVSTLTHSSNQSSKETFYYLSYHFKDFVEIFAEVSDHLGHTDDKNLLMLYDRWLKNKSERIRIKLLESGIDPLDADTQQKQ